MHMARALNVVKSSDDLKRDFPALARQVMPGSA